MHEREGYGGGHGGGYGGEGMASFWENMSEDKKNAFIKAKLNFKMKVAQAKLEFLKELQDMYE